METNAITKLTAYGILLVAVFGVGAAIGGAVGPIDVGGDPAHVTVDHDIDEHPEHP